jgi:hypothetical protein
LNWTGPDGVTRTFTKSIAHSKEQGVICWREASEDETPKKPGRPTSSSAEELIQLLPPEGLAFTEWAAKAKEECGVSSSTLHSYRRKLAAENRIAKSTTSGKWQPVKCNKCNNVKNTLSAPGAINAPLKGGALFIAPRGTNTEIIVAPPVLEEVAEASFQSLSALEPNSGLFAADQCPRGSTAAAASQAR